MLLLYSKWKIKSLFLIFNSIMFTSNIRRTLWNEREFNFGFIWQLLFNLLKVHTLSLLFYLIIIPVAMPFELFSLLKQIIQNKQNIQEPFLFFELLLSYRNFFLLSFVEIQEQLFGLEYPLKPHFYKFNL